MNLRRATDTKYNHAVYGTATSRNCNKKLFDKKQTV